ncbi:MAG: hypothetical protein UIB61_08365 [Treponema sp.]|nr:hypothetical protein [Treponema sp.]
MRVYIFSLPQNLEIARKIQDFLNLKGHSVKLFDSDSQFFSFVYQKEKIPDFVVYDYLFFNHNLWNIYNFMKSENCLVPLIFFNDPAIHSESTKFFLKNTLNLLHAENKIDWEKYDQIVSDAAKIIDSTKVENKKTETETEIVQKIQNPSEKQHINPEKRISKELSGINLAIFKKLFNNLNNCVPLKELQNSEELKKQIRETTVFCSISKIRKAMKNADEDAFEILKNPDGYTMISRY